jgi:hypothetical protein
MSEERMRSSLRVTVFIGERLRGWQAAGKQQLWTSRSKISKQKDHHRLDIRGNTKVDAVVCLT